MSAVLEKLSPSTCQFLQTLGFDLSKGINQVQQLPKPAKKYFGAYSDKRANDGMVPLTAVILSYLYHKNWFMVEELIKHGALLTMSGKEYVDSPIFQLMKIILCEGAFKKEHWTNFLQYVFHHCKFDVDCEDDENESLLESLINNCDFSSNGLEQIEQLYIPVFNFLLKYFIDRGSRLNVDSLDERRIVADLLPPINKLLVACTYELLPQLVVLPAVENILNTLFRHYPTSVNLRTFGIRNSTMDEANGAAIYHPRKTPLRIVILHNWLGLAERFAEEIRTQALQLFLQMRDKTVEDQIFELTQFINEHGNLSEAALEKIYTTYKRVTGKSINNKVIYVRSENAEEHEEAEEQVEVLEHEQIEEINEENLEELEDDELEVYQDNQDTTCPKTAKYLDEQVLTPVLDIVWNCHSKKPKTKLKDIVFSQKLILKLIESKFALDKGVVQEVQGKSLLSFAASNGLKELMMIIITHPDFGNPCERKDTVEAFQGAVIHDCAASVQILLPFIPNSEIKRALQAAVAAKNVGIIRAITVYIEEHQLQVGSLLCDSSVNGLKPKSNGLLNQSLQLSNCSFLLQELLKEVLCHGIQPLLGKLDEAFVKTMEKSKADSSDRALVLDMIYFRAILKVECSKHLDVTQNPFRELRDAISGPILETYQQLIRFVVSTQYYKNCNLYVSNSQSDTKNQRDCMEVNGSQRDVVLRQRPALTNELIIRVLEFVSPCTEYLKSLPLPKFYLQKIVPQIYSKLLRLATINAALLYDNDRKRAALLEENPGALPIPITCSQAVVDLNRRRLTSNQPQPFLEYFSHSHSHFHSHSGSGFGSGAAFPKPESKLEQDQLPKQGSASAGSESAGSESAAQPGDSTANAKRGKKRKEPSEPANLFEKPDQQGQAKRRK